MTRIAAAAPPSLTRRAAMVGGAVALGAPMLGLSASAAHRVERRFDIQRSGSSIGMQTTTVSRDGVRLDVAVQVTILIRILGVAVYRYSLESEERWEDGRLMALDGVANDDGRQDTARVRREDGGLVSSGSFSGDLPEGVATTTYFTQEFLKRGIWISTQTGAPLAISARRDGSEAIQGLDSELVCARWRLEGDLPVTLYYDGRGEWMGNAFDAGGVEARFAATSETGRLAPLWDA